MKYIHKNFKIQSTVGAYPISIEVSGHKQYMDIFDAEALLEALPAIIKDAKEWKQRGRSKDELRLMTEIQKSINDALERVFTGTDIITRG